MNYMHTFRKAEEFGIHPKAAVFMRCRYLFLYIDYLLDQDNDIAPIWAKEALTEIEWLQNKIFNPPETEFKLITSAEREQALEYPIEDLIEFYRGKAYAWCHNDSNPSLNLNKRHNRAHCFVCNMSFNPIDVRMHHENLTYNQAVRSLL